jgi:hypothetical protein
MNIALWKQFEGRYLENTYRLTRILGVGGFGGVFLADHVVENRFIRHVAVKLIPSDPDQMQLQLNELVSATTLQHPHLLQCFHAGRSRHTVELSLVQGVLLKTRVIMDAQIVAEKTALGRLTHQFTFPIADGANRYEAKAVFKLALITFDIKSCTLVVGNQLLCSEP